mgnify:CR=1 FL=1
MATKKSDFELVTSIKTGDQGAFEELLNRYTSKVLNLALRVTRSQEDAEEVLARMKTLQVRRLAVLAGGSFLLGLPTAASATIVHVSVAPVPSRTTQAVSQLAYKLGFEAPITQMVAFSISGAEFTPDMLIKGLMSRKLRSEVQDAVLRGENYKVTVKWKNRYGREMRYSSGFEGVVPYIERQYTQAETDTQRQRWAEYLRELVPSAKVGVGHGSLTADQLEKVMTQFVVGEIDILVATTIVAVGLVAVRGPGITRRLPILLGGATGPFSAILTALGMQPKLGTVAATKSTGATGATAGTASTATGATGVGVSSAAVSSAAASSVAVTGAAATGAAATTASSGAVGIGGIAAALGVGKAVAIGASVATVAIIGVGTGVVVTQNNGSTEANEIARGIVPDGAIPGAQSGFETVAVAAADQQAEAIAQARQDRAAKAAKDKANAKKRASADSAVVAQPEEIVIEDPVIVEEPSSPGSGSSGGSSKGGGGNSRSSNPDNNSSSKDSDSGEFVVTPVE